MGAPFGARRLAPLPLAIGLLSAALCARGQSHATPDEMTVTGALRDRAPGEIAQSVTVLRGDTLARIRAANLGETLANQLGVSSSYFGAGASRPIIRGLAGARVQMLEDGIASLDVATVSDDHAVTVEPLAADQIEIFRGPTTLLYGSGAVGGVVNTVTTRIPTRRPDDPLSGAVELRGDTVASRRGVAVRLDGGAAKFAWHVDAGRRDADDYEIPRFAASDPQSGDRAGVVENSAARSDGAAVGVSWLGDGGFIGLGINGFETLYGIPGIEASTPAVRIDLRQRRVDLRGGRQGLAGPIESVNVQAGVGDYEHRELEGAEVGTEFTNDAAELRLEFLQRAVGRWSGAFGLQAGERQFAALGAEAFVPPVDSRTLGLFLVEQVALERWELSAGGRLESAEHTPANGLPVFDARATSVSLGGVRSFGDGYSFAVTLAQSERLPVAEELYSNGPHLATGVVQRGSASLRREVAQHVESGFRGQKGRLNWSATAFYTRYDDFIFLEDTGAIDPVEALPIFGFAQADADFRGLEMELFVPLLAEGGNEVDLRLFADYVRGELTTGERLPRLPPLRFGARFEYHNERFLVGFEATRYDDQREVAPFEAATAGYLLVNADFSWRLAAVSGAEFELFVNASNLGDDEARKHTSFVKHLAPLPGRNFGLGVRSRF